MLYFIPHQLSVRVALFFVLLAGPFGWARADASTAITAPNALTSCRPTFLNGCFTGGINSFTVNSVMLSNVTGCSTGYASYTAATTNVAPGQPYSFAGTFTNSSFANGVTIWADLNRDGTFGATEVIFQAPTTVTTNSFSGSLTIPPNTATGPVDVRVVVAYNTIPAGLGACGSYSYGETEDYVLNVITPTAYNPTNTGVGSTSAVFLWNNLGTASSYDVQWRPIGGAYTTISGSTNNTGYQWQARASCGAGVYSAFTSPVSFTTQSYPRPYSLNTYSVGLNRVTLSWNPGGYFTGQTFTAQYRPASMSATTTGWTSVSGIGSSNYLVTGLEPGTSYQWQVNMACRPTESSVFSPSTTFTTLPHKSDLRPECVNAHLWFSAINLI